MTASSIQAVETPEQLQEVRALLVEYANSLAFHICFEDFQKELEALPGAYARPSGALFLGLSDGKAAGCIALKHAAPQICEMKRLYVRPDFRGQRLGRKLVETAIDAARKMRYTRIRLDTLLAMKAARALYHSMGFREIGGDDEKIDMELELV